MERTLAQGSRGMRTFPFADREICSRFVAEFRYNPQFTKEQMKALRSFRLSGERPLGPLEQRLLETLWPLGNATVRELLNAGLNDLAYTTVMTTLDRLHRKELLDRVSEGKAFRYSPRYSREELRRAAAGEAIRELFGTGESSLPLSYLIEILSEEDAEVLDDLQKLVERKQAELRKEDKP